MNKTLPTFLKPFLWSYDFDQLDVVLDKKRIITNVLNLGSKEATDWLFSTYTQEDIGETIRNPFPGEWNKKSLNYWSLVLNVEPGNLTRAIS